MSKSLLRGRLSESKFPWVALTPTPTPLGLNIDRCIKLNAYEVKNKFSSFERLFKVEKNGVFLFGISLFVMEIFTFLYYANAESDDAMGGSTKTVQHPITNISRNI